MIVLFVAVLTYILNVKNSKRTLSNKFKEKQFEAVSDLVEILNSSILEITFTTFSKNGSTGGVYQANIFEIENLQIFEKDREFFEHPIGFAKNSNQLFDFKPFLNNSYLPSSISKELEKFYCRRSYKIALDQLLEKKIIIINSKYYEENIWDKEILKGFTFWEADVFAFLNFNNFIECSRLLKKSILDWLSQNNIAGININDHMAH
jgi:hypothetical protein